MLSSLLKMGCLVAPKRMFNRMRCLDTPISTSFLIIAHHLSCMYATAIGCGVVLSLNFIFRHIYFPCIGILPHLAKCKYGYHFSVVVFSFQFSTIFWFMDYRKTYIIGFSQ